MLAKNSCYENVVLSCPIDIFKFAEFLDMIEDNMFGDDDYLSCDPDIRSAFVNLKNIVDDKFSKTCSPDSIANLAAASVVVLSDPDQLP